MKTQCMMAMAVCVAAGMLKAAPMNVNYEGVLTESGMNVTGTRSMEFELVDSSGATVYWDSGAQSVSVDDGYFSVVLGAGGMPPLTEAVFTNSGNIYIRVSVAGTPLLPIKPLSSVPYAVDSRRPHKVYDAVVSTDPSLGDFTSIDAALASGAKSIYVLPGVYTLTTSIVVSAYVELCGASSEGRALAWVDCSGAMQIALQSYTKIHNLAFWNASVNGALYVPPGKFYVDIADSIFEYGSTGIKLQGASWVNIERCYFIFPLAQGVALDNAQDCVVRNCAFGMLSGNAIAAISCQRCQMLGNQHDAGITYLDMQDCTGMRVDGATVRAGTGDGIRLARVADSQFSHISVSLQSHDGVYAQQVTNCTFSDIIAATNGASGVDAVSGFCCSFANITARDNGLHGLRACSDSVVNNVIAQGQIYQDAIITNSSIGVYLADRTQAGQISLVGNYIGMFMGDLNTVHGVLAQRNLAGIYLPGPGSDFNIVSDIITINNYGGGAGFLGNSNIIAHVQFNDWSTGSIGGVSNHFSEIYWISP